MRINAIIDGKLYQSSTTINDVQAPKKIEALGIKCVVNMYLTSDIRLMGNVHYMQLPIADGKRLLESDKVKINSLVDRIVDEFINAGMPCLVHCYGGRNRSALVNALVVRRLLNLNGKEAVEYIRSKRKGSLSNQVFVQYLEGMGACNE